jgi:dCMP deaminase
MDKWDRRFMELVDTVSNWSSCFQANRQMGAVIVKNKRIMTTGYNGAPSGIPSCKEKGECMRRKLGIPSGQQGQLCYAIHAEQNALIQAARMGVAIEGATLYCTHQPCSICARLIINAGIARIVYRHSYPDDFSLALINEAGIKMEQYHESGDLMI